MKNWITHRDRPWWAWAPGLALTALAVYALRSVTDDAAMLAGANVWEVADWICMEGLDILTNKLGVVSYFSTDRQAEFEKEYPVGDTVRVPLPVMGTIRNGLGYSGAPITDKHTTITADQVFGMDFDIDSVEQALRTGRSKEFISKKVIEPFMVKMAQEWDSRGAAFAALNTPNITGVLGTDPTTFTSTTVAARQMLMEYAGSADEQCCHITPAVMSSLRAVNAAAFNPVMDVSKAFRTGIYKMADNFDMYESMSLLSYTSGTWASPTGLTVKTAVASGDTSVVLNCTTGDQFNQGDVLSFPVTFRVNPITKQKIASRALQVVVTAPFTGAASTATVQIAIGPYGIIGPGDPYQNVDRLPQVNEVVTPFTGTTFTANTAKTGTQMLAFNSRAFMLVGIPLEVPKSAEKAAQKRDENSGIGIRFTKTWDAIQSRMIHRLDTCGGFGVGYADSCSVRILGA